MPDITVILVAYNSAGVIGRALASLCGQPSIASVVVADNGSMDETRGLIRRDFPQVMLLENAANEGFGRANNRALETVATPYALLLNPDAALEAGAVAALLEAMERTPDAAIIAPMLYDEQGAPDHSYKRNVFNREKKRGSFIIPEGDLCAEFLSGAVWLLRMEAMKRVGFFDPNIFLYYEDDDVCMRARQAGYSLVLAYGAAAVHSKGASSGEASPASEFFKQKQLIRSRLYIEKKYRGEKAAARLAMRLRRGYFLKAAWYGMRRHKSKLNRYNGRLSAIGEFTAEFLMKGSVF